MKSNVLLTFFNKINLKGPKHQLVWSYILGKTTTSPEINIFEIITKYKIPKPTLYNILSFGFDILNNSDFEYKFYLKNNSIKIVDQLPSDVKIKKSRSVVQVEKVKDVQKRKSTSKKPLIKIPEEVITQIHEIVNYLNLKCEKNFSPDNAETQSLILLRLKEGYILSDFFKIIDIKSVTWKDTWNDKHLRPITLFGDKMESYLNEKLITPENTQKSSTQVTYETAQQSNNILAERYSTSGGSKKQ